MRQNHVSGRGRSLSGMAILILIPLLLFFLMMPLSACKIQTAGGQPNDEATDGGNGDSENNEEGKKGEDEDDEEDPPVPVKVVNLESGTISATIDLNSVIEAEEQVDVYTQASGIVRALKVEEGDRVREGKLLARLEDEELRLTEAKAKQALENARSTLERTTSLYEKELVSQEDYDTATLQFGQAELDWQTARVNLDYTRIKAPITGVVSFRDVRYGDWVTAGSHAFSMVDMNSLVARVYVPEKRLPQVRVSQPVVGSLDSLPGASLDGRVLRISPVIDPDSGTAKVTVKLDDPEKVLKPGMFARIRVITDTRPEAVLVPKRCIVHESGTRFVFKVEDDTAIRVGLTPGYSNSEYVEELEALSPGDRIISVGQNALQDKVKVKIITDTPPGDDQTAAAEPTGETEGAEAETTAAGDGTGSPADDVEIPAGTDETGGSAA